MSNPNTVSLQLVAAVANGICQSQTPAAAGALTLNGSLVTSGVATMDVARRVLIASGGADAGVVFTITGTGRPGTGQTLGPVQSETITGVTSAASQYSVLDYATITSVTASAGTAGAITVGTNGVASTVWVVDDFLHTFWALAGACYGPAGTTYTVEHTYDDPNAQPGGSIVGAEQWSMFAGSNVPAKVRPNASLNNVSGNNDFSYPNQPIFAHRLTINSGTGLVLMQSIQAGLSGR